MGSSGFNVNFCDCFPAGERLLLVKIVKDDYPVNFSHFSPLLNATSSLALGMSLTMNFLLHVSWRTTLSISSKAKAEK